MRKMLLAGAVVLGLAVPADAVTLRDLISLASQGVSDDILIALVDADRSVFHLTAGDVRSLKDEGLSDRLVIHLLRTPATQQPVEAPRLAIADRPVRQPVAVEPVRIIERETVVAVPVPVYVPVLVPRPRVEDPEPPARAEPVYWGYGGKRRPDAWQETPVKRRVSRPNDQQ